MMSITFYNLFRLLFGTLYPAYASYKAVKTKNVKEYVKWMMYWIVFAFFTCIETFADIFIAWVPFYYELKILFVLWLLSPATKGSSILYRKLVHPQLSKREKDIDSYINKASDQGYSAILSVGSKSISYASNMLLSTAIKGQTKLVDQLKKSYSLSDVSNMNEQDQVDYAKEDLLLDDETDNRLIEEQYQREMMEKENLGGGRDKPHKRRTNLNQQEISQDDGEVTVRRTNKTNYNHKEVSHYGTLPRTRSKSRPSINKDY